MPDVADWKEVLSEVIIESFGVAKLAQMQAPKTDRKMTTSAASTISGSTTKILPEFPLDSCVPVMLSERHRGLFIHRTPRSARPLSRMFRWCRFHGSPWKPCSSLWMLLGWMSTFIFANVCNPAGPQTKRWKFAAIQLAKTLKNTVPYFSRVPCHQGFPKQMQHGDGIQ